MMELTSHQTSVGGVLEYGNQLISEGLVSEKEENDIRDQMISLNERWEALRVSAMERQTSLHEKLMKLQQQQIDQLADWLDKAEARIDKSSGIGADIEAVRKQVENHKSFQEDLENQQQRVNSLTHMVVVVDDAAGENATADLEEQLAQLGDRWSSVCRWTEQRWVLLQEVLNNWQEYRDEERRLSKWLSEKENEVDVLKHVDMGDPESIAHHLQKLLDLEQEMEAQQATFGTFNMAAERVAEHLDEDSPGLDNIQDKMEEFNDQWNKITTEVGNRIALLKGVESKLQPFKLEIDEKTYWLNETEMTLKSPKMNFDNDKMSSDELSRQYSILESLDGARNQRKPSVLAIQKKGDEIMEQIRSQGTIPVSFEHNLKTFNERWETVTKLIDDKKHKASLARQRREVMDINSKVETIIKEVERFMDMLGIMPDNEYEIKSQLDQCKHKIDDLHSNERHLIKLKELSRNLSKEDRQTPIFQMTVKRLDDRWTTVSSKIEERKRQLTSLLESGPPQEYLTTMDTVLLSIKNAETSLGGDFQITEVGGLEDQIRRNKQIQTTLQEQKRNIDYLNSTSDKFMKSLPRQKLEQLRAKLTDVNNKWKDVIMVIEKRQTLAQKAINQNNKFADELKGLNKWIAEVNDFLNDQEPAAGDPETLEAQLDQSEALQSDITKLQRKLDSLNETATYMLAKATPTYAQRLHTQQDDVTNRWDALVRHAHRVKDNLLAALEKYQKLNHDMKEMSHWITQTERSIADDDRDIASGEITKEKIDHYKDLQQDVSKRAPVVVRINTTANQLADHTKQGSAKPLVESLKKLNSDWSRLKNK
ncbi:dystrophin, partial [Exaiptasia diaphana]|uniref:Dystrophin n=1 Tax=Exaiptasia diaphana TaxID=2652724 RepID=A0A913WTM4_EXADI